LIGGLVVSGRIVLLAQDSEKAERQHEPALARQEVSGGERRLPEQTAADGRMAAGTSLRDAPASGSLQDALLRPYRFPFGIRTPLRQVCAHLKQTLKAAVVLDLAALDRQDVEPEDTVQLDLEGVRLKTGLKLLLEQVGLTYRVVAEDNLLIITDSEGADDPLERILSELRALHRDLHAVQDDLDDLRDYMGDDRQRGRVRKPTIIEELPDVEGPKPEVGSDKPGSTKKHPGADAPAAGARPAPARVPLHGPRGPAVERKRIVTQMGRA
jgi:hypothetical protein